VSVLIKVDSAMNPHQLAVVGMWLKWFDVEAHDGQGDAHFTDRRESALKFETVAEAFEAWRTQSRVRPLRADGHPNRPLTAFAITFEAGT
jgi:hypothetical protein